MRVRVMTGLVLVAAVAAAAVAFARSGAGPSATGVPVAAPPLGPLLGIVSERQQPQRLVRVDPDTLRPRPGRGVDVGTEGCAPRTGGSACWFTPPWSFSPDRSLLALARHDRGVVRSLRLADVRRMRVTADVPLTGGAVGLVAWPERERLLAVQDVCCDERQQLLVVDVAERRVVARRPLEGTVLRVGRTPDELVLLVAPAKAIGPARLAVVDGRGAVGSVRLERMPAGQKLVDPSSHRIEQRLPGLAVDPKGRRAFVVADGLVADVDLASLAVSYHEPVRSTSLLSRLRDWLDPVAYAKGASGPVRSAHWLGGGLLAVTGTDEESSTDAGARITPAGLSLLDTRSWSVRTIDSGATDVRVAGDLLLATSLTVGEGDPIGLTAYDFDGDKRFQVLDGREAWVEQVYEGRAYVSSIGRIGRPAPMREIDLAAGRIAGKRTRPLPWLLLDAASGWWDGR